MIGPDRKGGHPWPSPSRRPPDRANRAVQETLHTGKPNPVPATATPRAPRRAKTRHPAPSLPFCKTKPGAIPSHATRPARHTAQPGATNSRAGAKRSHRALPYPRRFHRFLPEFDRAPPSHCQLTFALHTSPALARAGPDSRVSTRDGRSVGGSFSDHFRQQLSGNANLGACAA